MRVLNQELEKRFYLKPIEVDVIGIIKKNSAHIRGLCKTCGALDDVLFLRMIVGGRYRYFYICSACLLSGSSEGSRLKRNE